MWEQVLQYPYNNRVRRRSRVVERACAIGVPGGNAVTVGVAFAISPCGHSGRRLSRCAGGPAMSSEDAPLGSLVAMRSRSQLGWCSPFRNTAIAGSRCAGGPTMSSEDALLRSLAATRSQSQSGWHSPFRHAAIVRDGRAGAQVSCDVERGRIVGVPDGNTVAVAVGVVLAVLPRGQSPPAMQVSAPVVTQMQVLGSVALLTPEVARARRTAPVPTRCPHQR